MKVLYKVLMMIIKNKSLGSLKTWIPKIILMKGVKKLMQNFAEEIAEMILNNVGNMENVEEDLRQKGKEARSQIPTDLEDDVLVAAEPFLEGLTNTKIKIEKK